LNLTDVGKYRLTSPQNVDTNFMSARRGNLDIFNFQRLACAPADGSLAFDGVASSVGHDVVVEGR
jgi:hypothetical protein